MFIVHGAWFRRNMRWLLAIVLILLIPSFVALFTNTDAARGRNQKLPSIGGKPVNAMEYERTRSVVTAEMMLNSGGQMPKMERLQEVLNQETVVRLMLLRKAREFNIRVSDDELVSHIQGVSAFRNEQGQFDPERYRMFLVRLTNSRITETQFEEIMRQQLIVQRLEDLIATAAKVPPLAVRNMFNALHERVTLDYVELSAADYKQPIEVTDAEIQAYYDQHQEEYRTPRQLKVRYVHVPADEAAQKVSDEDIAAFYERSSARFGTNTLASVKEEIRKELARSRAFAQAGDRATELTVKLVPEPGKTPPDFATAAAALQLPVKETGFFGPTDELPGITAGTEFNQRVATLTKDSPVGDPVEGQDGYYVMELVDVRPSEIPTLATVKVKVVAALKEERALAATRQQGEEVATKLQAAVGAGQSFAAAAQALKLTVKKSEPFNMTEPTPDLPASQQLHELSVGMRVGEVSRFVPTETGGVVFTVKDRTEPTPEEFEKQREQLTQVLLRQSREAVWQDWVRELMRVEQVSL